MLDIVFNHVSKNYGNKEIFDQISFEIKSKEKIAIIGQNGSGKTTIFKMIAKEESSSTGEIIVRKDAKVGILTQYPNEELNNYTIKEILYSSFKEIKNLEKKLIEYEKKLNESDENNLEKNIIKYTKIQEEYQNMGGYEVDSKIDKLVSAFNITSLLNRKYIDLSGGEKTIVNLISIILQEPDILLLDEPTNHLDISMLELLEKFLNTFNKTVVIISHDRFFLDKTVNKIFLVDNKKIEIFNGNYSYYIKENELRIMREFNEYKNQQKKITAMKNSIKRLKEYGKLAYPCGENFFRRAASIEKRLEKIEVLEKPKKSKKIDLAFSFNTRSGNDIIMINNYCYTIGNKELFKNANTSIKYQEKVVLIGSNGSGKSTLIKKIISNDNNIKIGSNIKIGYISQDIKFENEELTVIEEARKFFEGYEEHLRSALVKFLFYSEGIYTKINKLSGGEKLRLKLFCLMQEDNNLLIMDEPTNHIDINTKEILEEALNDYKGTLLIISHDRFFINKIATRILSIENKKIISYIGNYNDYLSIKNKKED